MILGQRRNINFDAKGAGSGGNGRKRFSFVEEALSEGPIVQPILSDEHRKRLIDHALSFYSLEKEPQLLKPKVETLAEILREVAASNPLLKEWNKNGEPGNYGIWMSEPLNHWWSKDARAAEAVNVLILDMEKNRKEGGLPTRVYSAEFIIPSEYNLSYEKENRICILHFIDGIPYTDLGNTIGLYKDKRGGESEDRFVAHFLDSASIIQSFPKFYFGFYNAMREFTERTNDVIDNLNITHKTPRFNRRLDII